MQSSIVLQNQEIKSQENFLDSLYALTENTQGQIVPVSGMLFADNVQTPLPVTVQVGNPASR